MCGVRMLPLVHGEVRGGAEKVTELGSALVDIGSAFDHAY